MHLCIRDHEERCLYRSHAHLDVTGRTCVYVVRICVMAVRGASLLLTAWKVTRRRGALVLWIRRQDVTSASGGTHKDSLVRKTAQPKVFVFVILPDEELLCKVM